MRKGLTEIVFILDRSGSMGGLESDTIGGYNSLIEKQRLLKPVALESRQTELQIIIAIKREQQSITEF